MADVITNNGDSFSNDVEFASVDNTTAAATTKQAPAQYDDTVKGKLIERIAELERDNADSHSRAAALKSELDSLRTGKDSEFDRAESERRAAEMIAKRASELEGEVARLQHDLISAVNDSSEAREEIQSLHKKIEELKNEKSSVEEKVKVMAEKMEELMLKSKESEKYVAGLMEKIALSEAESAAASAVREACREVVDEVGSKEGGMKAWEEKVTVIGAVSAGAVVAVVVAGIAFYVRHSRN